MAMDASNTAVAESITPKGNGAEWPFGALEPGSFGAILADCPWHFKSYTALRTQNWSSGRHVERHYRTMKLPDIKALPVAALAAKTGCHLFLCATGPCLPQALEVMAAWGFKYSTVALTWAKLKRSFDAHQLRVLPTADGDFHVGLGLTTRKNCEFVLLGRRGNARRISKKVRELVLAPVREHSRKPDEYRERIEQYCEGPFLEMFARSTRPNWSAWGLETGKFQ
jgi:N6-adenosine-specific RNA methylase IME4